MDTLRITVNVQTPPNTPATFIEPSPDGVYILDEGDPMEIWPIKVVDNDGDSLTVTYITEDFLMDTLGMELADFDQTVQGIVNSTLSWNPVCNGFNFSTRQNFVITLVADDNDFCSYNLPDTARFDLTLRPPDNTDPIIDTDLTPVYSEEFVDGGTARIYEKIEFNVSGHDEDADYPISLRGLGVGYHLIDYQMNFPETTGTQDISSHFSWPLECSLFSLAEKDSFNIMFIVEDKSNKCKIYQADTVEVAFKILPPINTPPSITPLNLHPETETGINTATSYWNQPIEFLLTGTDPDENPVIDNLRLELYDSSGNVMPSGFSFNPVSGKTEISSKFIWNPDCSIFTENDTLNTYQFYFRVFDDHCESADTAMLTLHINIKDYKSTDKYFDPASVITPNADEYNDYFALDGYDLRPNGTDPDLDVNLPLDNCLNRFEYINIYNRWGKLVFTSDNRFFRWYAPNAAAGVYYYFVRFTNKDYKGSVTVRN
jgi:hypothetical protein